MLNKLDFPSKCSFDSVKSVCVYVMDIIIYTYIYILQHNWDGYALVTIAILIWIAL